MFDSIKFTIFEVLTSLRDNIIIRTILLVLSFQFRNFVFILLKSFNLFVCIFSKEINSYLNASQLEKLFNISKKFNVTSKDRMISDLNSLLLYLIQICHTFELKYRPMQTYIRVCMTLNSIRQILYLLFFPKGHRRKL